jgi:8-oxo-dGTP pyrophosphatase MutT (NUDIX family)
VLRVETIAETLALQEPIPAASAKPGCAAVALILAGEGTDLKLCFIKRADRDGDPWSGNMALPGGRTCEADSDIQSTAEREVEEEVGVKLDHESLIGRLPDLPISRLGIDTRLVLSTFVYYIGPHPTVLAPNHEVAAAFWIDLDHLWDARNRTHFDTVYRGQQLAFPAIRHGDNLIWGLTFRVLILFGEKTGRPLASE